MVSREAIMECYYINLDRRTDRRAEIEVELVNLGIPTHRFAAIERTPGGIGCSHSHLAVLKLARDRGLPAVMILEDDFQFCVSKNEVATCLANLPDKYNVVFLAYNLLRSEPPSDGFGKVLESQSTPGYIVSQGYYDTLIARWDEGLAFYEQYPEQHWNYTLDQYWKPLQPVGSWYYTSPRIGRQRAGYSDIALRHMNYDYKITYVTTFLIPPDRPVIGSLDHYRTQFEKIANTGIPIVLFLDDTITHWTFPENVHVVKASLEDTWIDSIAPASCTYEITHVRAPKDTFGYMKIQHTKAEWLMRARNMNVYATDWYAWIDFGIVRVLDQPAIDRLYSMMPPLEPRIITPGCWAWILDDANVWKGVHWRFCGGFILMHKNFVEPFWEQYKATVLRELPKFTWEVNIWALMESDGLNFGWTPCCEHSPEIIPRSYAESPWANIRGYLASIQTDMSSIGCSLSDAAKADLEDLKNGKSVASP